MKELLEYYVKTEKDMRDALERCSRAHAEVKKLANGVYIVDGDKAVVVSSTNVEIINVVRPE